LRVPRDSDLPLLLRLEGLGQAVDLPRPGRHALLLDRRDGGDAVSFRAVGEYVIPPAVRRIASPVILMVLVFYFYINGPLIFGALWTATNFGQAFLVYLLLIIDRKSTRLNSSHVSISYAVFCLKKKTT